MAHHVFSLSRPQPTMALLRFWATSQPSFSPSNIESVAVGKSMPEGFEVWACMGSRLIKWTAMNEGWEQVGNYTMYFGIIVTLINSLNSSKIFQKVSHPA